jgi:hypothetical protein
MYKVVAAAEAGDDAVATPLDWPWFSSGAMEPLAVVVEPGGCKLASWLFDPAGDAESKVVSVWLDAACAFDGLLAGTDDCVAACAVDGLLSGTVD